MLAGRDQPVEPVAQARLPRRSREQHLARPRVARQPVDHRIAAVGRGAVRRRQPDRDPPRRRVAQRVAGERAAVDDLDDAAHRDPGAGAIAQAGDSACISAPKRSATRVGQPTAGAAGRGPAPGQATSTEVSTLSDRLPGAVWRLVAPARFRPGEDPAEPGGRIRHRQRASSPAACGSAPPLRRRRCGSTTSGRRSRATASVRFELPRRPPTARPAGRPCRPILPAASRTTGFRWAARSPRGGCRRPLPDSPPPSATRPVGSARRASASRPPGDRRRARRRSRRPRARASSRTSASPAIAPRRANTAATSAGRWQPAWLSRAYPAPPVLPPDSIW